MACHHTPWSKLGALALTFAALIAATGRSGESAKSPYKVRVQDEKAVVTEAEMPVDPVQRVNFQFQGNMWLNIRNEQNQTLHLSHFPSLYIDGQAIQIGQDGRFEVSNGKLPKTPGGKERKGYMNVVKVNDIRVTQTVELIATKSSAPGQKRRQDAVLVKHVVENVGKQAHKVGMRAYIDTYIVNNDGALFAAPTIPGKVLDGMELKDKTLPDYVQVLQQPDLKNPGFVAHLTLNLGSSIEKAGRVVLTRHGVGFGDWEMQPAMAGGDSAMGVFWDPKELKPGGKRETGYSYGQGIGVGPESEGRFNLAFGGSFEPGKLFTLSATINDPAPGQTLKLDLPKGMELVQGKEIEPVPGVIGERAQSLVMWKARVVEPGAFSVRVQSSTGVTQSKKVSISKTE